MKTLSTTKMYVLWVKIIQRIANYDFSADEIDTLRALDNILFGQWIGKLKKTPKIDERAVFMSGNDNQTDKKSRVIITMDIVRPMTESDTTLLHDTLSYLAKKYQGSGNIELIGEVK
jgi:hypothetical protein